MTAGAAHRDPLTLSLLRVLTNAVLGSRRFTDTFVRGLAGRSRGNRILEIGSGKATNGTYLKSYKHYFDATNDFIQSDINPAYGHRVVDLMRMEYEDAFDMILCLNVLEHVFDLEGAARSLHRAIRSPGLVGVVVPALYPLHDEPYDYWRLTEHSLRRVFSDFRDLEIGYSGLRRLPFMYSVLAKK